MRWSTGGPSHQTCRMRRVLSISALVAGGLFVALGIYLLTRGAFGTLIGIFVLLIGGIGALIGITMAPLPRRDAVPESLVEHE